MESQHNGGGILVLDLLLDQSNSLRSQHLVAGAHVTDLYVDGPIRSHQIGRRRALNQRRHGDGGIEIERHMGNARAGGGWKSDQNSNSSTRGRRRTNTRTKLKNATFFFTKRKIRKP